MLQFLGNLISINFPNTPHMSIGEVITFVQTGKPTGHPNSQVKKRVNATSLIVPSNQAFYTQIVPSSGPMLSLEFTFFTEPFNKVRNLGIIPKDKEIVRLGCNYLPCPLNAGFFLSLLLDFPSQLQHISLGEFAVLLWNHFPLLNPVNCQAK